MCPICTVAVVAGLGISRLLEIDDIISSIWIGSVVISVSFWIVSWLAKKAFWKKIEKEKTETFINILIFIFMYLTVLIPLKLDGSIGIYRNTLWGIDKIILGIATGSVVFLFGIWVDRKERKLVGKQLFSYQKVVFPILAVIIASAFFMAIIRH